MAVRIGEEYITSLRERAAELGTLAGLYVKPCDRVWQGHGTPQSIALIIDSGRQ